MEAEAQYLAKAEAEDESYCFPNTVEDYIVLTHAAERKPDGMMAPYLLGNLSYDRKNYGEACGYWMKGRNLNATVHRNLAIVLFNKMGEKEKALDELRTAFSMDKSDARILLELIQLEEKLGFSVEDRFALLDGNYETTSKRDDLFIIYISFLNRMGEHSKALSLLENRIFHPWEGGEGKVTKEYITALRSLALGAMTEGDYDNALTLLDKAMVYPHNLGEGKLEGCKDNEIHYMKGLCLEKTGKTAEAEKEYLLALEGKAEITGAMYYYDQSADIIAFQALALRKLGRESEAVSKFRSLIDYGTAHQDDTVDFDYFAVSLPDLQMWTDDLSMKNRAHCFYLMALGHEGLNNEPEAEECFTKALSINPDLTDAGRLEKALPLLK